jgi:hypothetical protein
LVVTFQKFKFFCTLEEFKPFNSFNFKWIEEIVTEMREDLGLRVFENRVLRKIFGRKRDGATGDWRRGHNDELPDLCSSPHCIQVIKSRRNIWPGGEERCVQVFGG